MNSNGGGALAAAFVPSNGMSSEVVAAGAIGVGIGIAMANLFGRAGVGAGACGWSSLLSGKKPSFAIRPSYKPGQQPVLPSESFGNSVHIFDPSKLQSSYNLMISTVTPRPIALVSTKHPTTGVDNVSPFSYFGAMGHDPPMLAIGFCRKNGYKKDSLVNFLACKEFAVNIISDWYLEAANHSCGDFSPDVDEFEQSGLTKAACDQIKAPRVKEAAVTYECLLEHVQPVVNEKGNPTTEIVLARVVRIHVDEDVLVENFDPLKPVVDVRKLRPVGRLGGNNYCNIGEIVDIPRPKV